jgi:hypothetical protein
MLRPFSDLGFWILRRRSLSPHVVHRLVGARDLAVLRLVREGYLVDSGWVESTQTLRAADATGAPIPWMTYAFVEFLEGRLRPDFSVFEFGTGQSTLYFAPRVARLVGVECNRDWYDSLRGGIPDSVTLHFCEQSVGGDYCRMARGAGGGFDLVVVDGRDRVNCMKQSLDALTDRGVMILDDSCRERYAEGRAYLTARGYRCLDFWGLAPIKNVKSCTSVFYRQGNCLQI